MKKKLLLSLFLLCIVCIIYIHSRPQKLDLSIPAVVLKVSNNELIYMDKTNISINGAVRTNILMDTFYKGEISIGYLNNKRMYIPLFTKNHHIYVNDLGNYYTQGYLFYKGNIISKYTCGFYNMQASKTFNTVSFMIKLDNDNNKYFIVAPAKNISEAKEIYNTMCVDWLIEDNNVNINN